MPTKFIKLMGCVAVASLMASTAMADQIVLDVAAWKGNEAQPAGLPELIAKFEAENPDIKVELGYLTRNDVARVLAPRLSGNNPPDVTMADMPLTKQWSKAGLLTNLGDQSAWVDRLTPAVKDVLLEDDAIHMMPLEIIGMGNFVNMGLLNKVGIETAPTTVEELKTACSALNDAGIKPLLLSGNLAAMFFVVANGVDASENSVASLGNGDVAFSDDPAFSAALDYVRELVDAKCFDPSIMAGVDPWTTALAEFKAGNFAMLPQGAWNIQSFSDVEGLDFAFAPIPATSESGIALDLLGPGWAIPTNAQHPEAARKFIDFFTENENHLVFLEAEAAYSTFLDGDDGNPAVTAPYDAARKAGGSVLWPFSTLAWPKPLEDEFNDSLTGFLLNLDKPNAKTIERWDETVEDNL